MFRTHIDWKKITSVGKTIILDNPDLDPKATDIEWRVTDAPGGATWYPPAKNAKIQSFTPNSSGVYYINVSYSAKGTRCSCDFIIDVDISDCNTSICPGSTTFSLGDSTKMDIQGIDPGATQIYWQVLNSPGGETWSPSGHNAITELFTPYIIDVYNMQVSYNLNGLTCICDFDLDVQLKPAQFRIELTWNGSGDVDLHLNSPSMKDPMTEKWETKQDCYFWNRKKSWGASLDVDNTKENGPENIVLKQDTAPTGKYYIGAANFEDADGRVATIKIYCGSNNPTVYKSRALKPADFRVVGSIDPDTCNIKCQDFGEGTDVHFYGKGKLLYRTYCDFWYCYY